MAKLLQLCDKLEQIDVGMLPVCEGNRLMGAITDCDIIVRPIAEGREPLSTTVWEVMTSDVCCCYEDELAEEEAPVRQGYRYLTNRKEHLDYPWALERRLPIGSGMIESGHRHVLQARLKKAGTALAQG